MPEQIVEIPGNFSLLERYEMSKEGIIVKTFKFNTTSGYRVLGLSDVGQTFNVFVNKTGRIETVKVDLRRITEHDRIEYIYHLQVMYYSASCEYFYANSIKTDELYIQDPSMINNLLLMLVSKSPYFHIRIPV